MSSNGFIGGFANARPKDALSRCKMSERVKQALNKVASMVELLSVSRTMSSLRKQHEAADWDWQTYRKACKRRTALEDWVYYAEAVYWSLNASIKSWPSGIPHFPSECKMYSVIVANWLLNNHLTYYGRVTTVVPHTIILNASHCLVKERLLQSTYNLLREAGASIIPTSLPNGGIISYPYKIQDGYNWRNITAKEFVQDVWGRNFMFVKLSELTEEPEYNQLKSLIAKADEGYFSSRFPMIMTASELLYVPEEKTPVIEFYVGGDY